MSSVSGGSASTRLDPDIGNTYVRQASAYLEREVAPNFGVRTGVVVNAKRQPYGTINVSRPLEAYAVPVTVIDPGPDGRLRLRRRRSDGHRIRPDRRVVERAAGESDDESA